MNRLLCWLILLGILSIATCSAAFAFGAVSHDVYILKHGEVHSGDLAVSASKAVIEGTIDGDLYVFSENVQVQGEVKGDVISFAASTIISGKVDGNIRAITQRLTVTGTVDKNVTAASQHFLMTDKGKVNGSTMLFAGNVDLGGTIGKDTYGSVDKMRVTGTLNQGISKLAVHQLDIDSSAVINGDIVYRSGHRATISPEAKITGKEVFSHDIQAEKHFLTFRTILLLMSVVSTIVLWLLIRYFFPVALLRINQQMSYGMLPQAGAGLLLLFATPIVTALLLFTVVGIPIALAIGASFILLLCVAKIFAGVWAGGQLAKRFHWRLHPLLAELIGVLGVLILTNIPLLGWLLALAIWSIFLGAIVSSVRQTNKTFS